MLHSVPTPDLGTDEAEVIELLVKVGQTIEIDTPLVLVESAKASMEVPSPVAGIVKEILVTLGAKISEGVLLLQVETQDTAQEVEVKQEKPTEVTAQVQSEAVQIAQTIAALPQQAIEPSQVVVPNEAKQSTENRGVLHCGPAVRRLARELGVDLYQVQGSAVKGRIVKEDVHGFVKKVLTTPVESKSVVSSGLPVLPSIDFSKWGEVEFKDLSKIQKLSAQNLHRAWLHIPHVTQFDEADITELETFRVAQKDTFKAQGISLTILSFLVKACAYILTQYPKFNASLSENGEQLVLKKYIHIGVAVDTPNGLVVPVIKNADTKSISMIAKELGELSAKARDKKLTPAEMQGASFSISSLGGIGGTAFTPIVNWPEVAILGVSRASQKPIWNGKNFEPRLMLPLSLSYDHRVIDGADGARFVGALNQVLVDIRRVLL
ncbi:MAG: dihydrolipoyllysine-residue acetyltransferase [Moraxellaceae bacterium]|nr:dihydrolipoyllysine-residue acetyltransferase [Moraxellaceae bacterium]